MSGPTVVANLPMNANVESIVRQAFPNLATLSPDGPGIVASMSGFLGIPSTGVEHAAREGRLYDRFQYTEAFRGKFDYLGQVILGLLYDTMDFLLGGDGLPMKIANTLKVTWDEISMVEGMLDREPEEASARVMLSTSERREGVLLRRGKAIELERGFVEATEEGAKHYVRQLRQIQKASLNTFSYDVLCTMLQVRSRDIHWRMNNWFSDVIDEQALNLYTNSFISWQKDSDGAARTVTLANEIQESRAKTTPSMMILPRGLENLLRGADNSDQLNYDKVGPVAESRRESDPMNITRFKGKRVRFTKKYDGLTRGALPIEPMCSDRIFGEFYVMAPLRPTHPFYQMHKLETNTLPPYTSAHRTIQVMDLRADRFGSIPLKDAVDNMQIFDGEGYVKGCNPKGKNLGKTMVAGKTTSTSPIEVLGRGGVHYVQVFGGMEQKFLSNNTFKLMVEQISDGIDKKTINPDNLTNLVFGDYNVTVWNFTALFNIGGAADEEYNPPKTTSGLKRGRELDTRITPTTPLVYATLGVSNEQPVQKISASTMGLGDMEKLNSDKMTILDPSVAKYYSGLVKTLDESKRLQVAQRTMGVLSSSDDAMITQELLTPLRETSQTSGLKEEQKIQKERLLEKLSQPFTGSLVDTPVKLSQTSSKTGLFTLAEVEEADHVEYLHPLTGEKLSRAEPFTMGTTRGLGYVLTVLGKTQNSSTTGALYKPDGKAYDETSAKFWLEVSNNPSLNEVERRLKWVSEIFTNNTDLYETAITLLRCPMHKKFFDFLINNNIFFPFVPVIARPWICVETCSVIIGTGGERLGAMYIKDPNVMKGSDVTSKMLQWHMTIYSKAMVHEPDLLSVFDDCALKSLKGGANLRWFPKEHIPLMKSKNWAIPKNNTRGSIFCLLGAYMEKENYPEVINFKSKRLRNPEREMINTPVDVFVETDQDEAFGVYLNSNPEDDNIFATWIEKQGNNLCFQGTQLLYHPIKQDFSCVIYSKNNHFGQNMYPGMMHDLRTMSKLLEDQHYHDPSKFTQFYSL